MISREVLHAFGFRKAIHPKKAGFSSKSYYNPELEIWYDPLIHADHTFAFNVCLAVAIKVINVSGDSVEQLLGGNRKR